MTVLRHNDISEGDLRTLLNEFAATKAQRWMWELGIARWYFGRFRPDELSPRTMQGRVFGPAGELQWRRMGDAAASPIRAVYLGQDPGGLLGADWRAAEVPPHSRQAFAVMWGRKLDTGAEPVWIEQRIPHRLRYPSSGDDIPERVQIEQEHLLSEDGAVQLCRWVRLLPFSPPQDDTEV